MTYSEEQLAIRQMSFDFLQACVEHPVEPTDIPYVEGLSVYHGKSWRPGDCILCVSAADQGLTNGNGGPWMCVVHQKDRDKDALRADENRVVRLDAFMGWPIGTTRTTITLRGRLDPLQST